MSKARNNVATLSQASTTADPGLGGMWTNLHPATSVLRMRDRLFIGDAAKATTTSSTFIAPFSEASLTEVLGSSWPEVNSSLLVGQTNGRIAITGYSRSSDNGGPSVTIGVSGFVWNDEAGANAWGLYSDTTRETGAGTTFGLEIAAKNKGADVQTNSYASASGVLGVHAVAGGDSAYGGEATAPSTAAVNIAKGSGAFGTWNVGIRFASNALTGADGTTGTGVALAMAKGHQIVWNVNSTTLAARIGCDVSSLASDTTLMFGNSGMRLEGTSGKVVFRALHVTSGVNNVLIQNAPTTGYPKFFAEGDDSDIGLMFISKGVAPHRFFVNGSVANEDCRIGGLSSAPVNYLQLSGGATGNVIVGCGGAASDIDINITPKGSGTLRFGTHTSNADAPISGYITIKDSGGTVRKLAVIS